VIGILLLDTDFPRFRGDIGNPESFGVAVKYARVEGASVDAIVSKDGVDPMILDLFIASAQSLEQAGAVVIGTSCGFLGAVQREIQQQLTVPFIASSLLLLPLLRTLFGATTPIAVLTFDGDKLGPRHFGGRVDPNVSIFGLDPESHWYQTIANNKAGADIEQARKDVLELVDRAMNHHPKLLLIECTNLSPWKQEIRDRTGLPVFDLVDALEWLHRGAGDSYRCANEHNSPRKENDP